MRAGTTNSSMGHTTVYRRAANIASTYAHWYGPRSSVVRSSWTDRPVGPCASNSSLRSDARVRKAGKRIGTWRPSVCKSGTRMPARYPAFRRVSRCAFRKSVTSHGGHARRRKRKPVLTRAYCSTLLARRGSGDLLPPLPRYHQRRRSQASPDEEGAGFGDGGSIQ